MRFDPDVPLKTVCVNGYPLHYLEMGEGEPVLLVHGSLCDCRYWKPQMAPIARSRRVIAVSLRHHWPATSRADDGSFSIAQHTQDLADLLQALGLSWAHVVGHSRGGRVALELARLHPAAVRTLVLADPGVQFADAGASHARAAFVTEATSRVMAGDIEGGLGLFVDSVNGENTWARMVEGFKNMARDNAGTLPGQAIEPVLAVADQELRALAIPTLLIGGGASPERYAQVLARLAATLPNTTSVFIQGAAHGMNLAKPHSFNTALGNFWNTTGQSFGTT